MPSRAAASVPAMTALRALTGHPRDLKWRSRSISSCVNLLGSCEGGGEGRTVRARVWAPRASRAASPRRGGWSAIPFGFSFCRPARGGPGLHVRGTRRRTLVGSGAPQSAWWPSGGVVRNGRVLARRPEGYRGTTMALEAATTSDRLLERDRELDAIRTAVLHAAQDTGGFVVIDGPAGVGKTALIDAAHGIAMDADLLVLRARGAELERAFGFGIVRQLFDEVLRSGAFDPATLFTGAARVAAPLLAVDVEGGAASLPTDDPYAARHALYWLLSNLAAQRPLAVLVDDAHWADSTSLGVLAHIANRLDGVRAALLVASRSEEALEPLDVLRRQAEAHGTLLHVQPLGAEAAAIVVRSFAPSADDALCRKAHVATGGNPFLLSELSRAALTGGPLPEQSPERVTREIAARLARLPEPARDLARAAAVLGNGVPLRQAAALAGLDEDAATAAADTLAAGGILRSVHPLEFLHPLIGAAAYAGLGPAARSRDHARAAHMLDAEGASPERVAAQLLRCQPAGDDWAFGRLVAAAAQASERSATDAVATFLQRALDEPAPAERRSEILLELGSALVHTDHLAAIRHAREALSGEL